MDIELGRAVTPAPAREKTLHEQMLAGASMQDLNDTMNEFYKLNDDLWMMVKGLPIEERKTVNDMIRDYISKKK